MPEEEPPKRLNTVETHTEFLIDVGHLYPDDADWYAATHHLEPYYTYLDSDGGLDRDGIVGMERYRRR